MRIADRMAGAAIAAAWCGLALAQTVAPSKPNISLVEGRGELLRFANDITRVVIAEPKIADAIVVSPREVMVNAKGPGHTTLVVWEGEGEPRHYEIAVAKDNTEWDSFLRKVQENANGAPVMV